jgi:iron complex transport system substrate-binding protein
VLVVAAGLIAGAAVVARVRIPAAATDADSKGGGIPRRIVSLAPALTEMCAEIGLLDCLVGRSSYCLYPPEVLALPDVGALLDPHLERIMQLQPDLLLVPRSARDQRAFLDAAGLPYLALPTDMLDDVFVAIRLLGERCARRAAAETLAVDLRSRVEAVRQRAAAVERRRVMLVVGGARLPLSAPWVAGPESYLGQLIELTGHQPVPTNLGRSYAPISLEQIVLLDPEVIIEIRDKPDAASDPLTTWATLGDLTAVRTRRVYVINGPQHMLPGPRFVETLDALVEMLEK